jgi:RHS repeat-associated protein
MLVASLIAVLGTLLMSAATPAARLGALAAPLTPPLDDFNRPNENPLSGGGNWARLNTASSTDLRLSNQRVEAIPMGAGNQVQGYRHWTPQIYGPDAEVYLKAEGGPDGDPYADAGESWRLLLRVQEAGGANTFDGYMLVVGRSTGGALWIIRRYTNGVGTQIGPTVDHGFHRWILFRAVGNALEGWGSDDFLNWSLVISRTDTMYAGGGRIAVGAEVIDSSFNPLIDGVGGGDLPPPGAPPLTQSIGICSGRGVHAIATSRCMSDPLNTLTGAFVNEVDDIATPGTGVSFAWSRSYDSSDPTTGRLGPGWTDSYATSLLVQGNGDVLLHGDEGQQVYYTKEGDGSFLGAPGSLSTLASVAGGYELRRVDQVVYRFDAQGRLLSMKDRNNQGLTLAYDVQGRMQTITDAASRPVTISYNASNLVSQVQTQDGRSASYSYSSGRLTSVTDVRGKTWAYGYDASGRLATIRDPLNHTQVTNVYGGDGRVQSQTDALAKTTTFAWNAGTQTATVTDARSNAWKDDYNATVLVSQTDPHNRVTTFAHGDGDLNTTAVTSPTSQQTSLTYDAAGNLLTATAPASLGSVQKTFAYNARNDPTQVTDARGKVTSYSYTPSGNVESVTRDGVQVASYTYDPQGRVLTSIDGNEKTTTYTYDANGNLASSTDPLGNKTTYTYDGAGRVLTRVDPKGNVAGCGCAADFTWTYTYNPAGQLLTETNPLGHQTTNVYDDAGRLTSTTDPNGHTTSYTYDDANRILTETAPDPDGGSPLSSPVTTYTYDYVGNKVTETDPLGRVTTFGYAATNRLISVTGPDPDGAGPLAAPVTTNAYEPNGSLAWTVEPRGNAQGANPEEYKTINSYDAAGRQLTETKPDPDGAGPKLAPVTTNAYDSVGNLASVTDANSHTTSYTYDAAGRVLTVTAPDAGVTTFTYDDAGNALTRRDDNQHVTTWAYDDAGRLASELKPDPDGAGPQTAPLTTHTYDPNGNLLTTVDPNGNATADPNDGKTTYGYDGANRLTSIDYSDPGTPDVTFTYDNVGNRLQMTDSTGTETRTYDNLDRLKTVTRGSDTFAYAHDAVGNVTQRTYPGQSPLDYGYDGLDRLQTVGTGAGQTTYAYDIASNLTQTTLPSANGHVETRVYDRIGRLTEVKAEKTGVTLARFVSDLDPVGNPLSVVRTGALAETQTYTYDANDRLSSVCFQAGACPGPSDPFLRLTYDKVGNRLTSERPGQSLAYVHNALDQLTAVVGATSFTYDQNGNQLTRGTARTYAYDQANRMKSATVSGATTTYSYDGDGVRLQASTGPSASEKTNFLWDVNQALPQIALERDGAGALLRRYSYGVQRLTMVAGSTTSYYHHDALGSVASVTGGAGNTRWTYSYEPFGLIRTEEQGSGTQPANLVRFTGEYLDSTGLYHLRARQYDPTWSRFLSPDPVSSAVDSAFIASYVYAANRPTVMVDRSGLVFEPAEDGKLAAGDATSRAPDIYKPRLRPRWPYSRQEAGPDVDVPLPPGCNSRLALIRHPRQGQLGWMVSMAFLWCSEGGRLTRAEHTTIERVNKLGTLIHYCGVFGLFDLPCGSYQWGFRQGYPRYETEGGRGSSRYRVDVEVRAVKFLYFNPDTLFPDKVGECRVRGTFTARAGRTSLSVSVPGNPCIGL